MKLSFFLIYVCLLSGVVHAQTTEANTGQIFGSGYSFYLTAPKGWILDNKSGQPQNLSVVFYPKGSSWDSAVTAMYASTWRLTSNETLRDVINMDIRRTQKSNPKLKIKVKPDLQISKGLVAQIRELDRDRNGNYEEEAFITDQKFVVVLVMTSRNQKDFNKKLGKFYELVKSYKLATQNK